MSCGDPDGEFVSTSARDVGSGWVARVMALWRLGCGSAATSAVFRSAWRSMHRSTARPPERHFRWNIAVANSRREATIDVGGWRRFPGLDFAGVLVGRCCVFRHLVQTLNRFETVSKPYVSE